MARMIKVHILGRNGIEIKEVNLQEAERILKETYADPLGGLVADRRTGEVIWEIDSNVEEVLIIDQMIGGG
ncbi:MAG: hypothetical protein OEZ00_04190 [Dehalococcoidia bacterium]|nr:hypothetical protein [Dehalococcoidia bacterium]